MNAITDETIRANDKWNYGYLCSFPHTSMERIRRVTETTEEKQFKLKYADTFIKEVAKYILTQISSKSNRTIGFYGIAETLNGLEKKWKKLDCEPAIKRIIKKISKSSKYKTPEENILDNVSDIAVSQSPTYTCFLVNEIEYSKIIDTNKKLNFIGFGTYTPQMILKKYKVFPFDKKMLFRIQELINIFC